ncbi:MAG TPA: sporulation initiation factor Spo0A [Oscillospiraceae bacterium]|nr:sporulation initiation factor Spo0A [Oscillospiraceae bacterium]HPS33793.1 sporulation initiation factor Spo0A [Oscillospiraceae bacterium]
MNKEKIAGVLEKVALLNGVTVEEVRREIGMAIMEGMSNPDPKAKANWAEMEADHGILSPEDVIDCLVQRAQNFARNREVDYT